MFPVYIYEKDMKLPTTGTYYVVAKDGIFLRKETGLVKALVKVERISFLEEILPWAKLKLPKIPTEILARTLLFFRAIYKKDASEAAVLIHYNALKGEYLLHCPQQEVSAASVHYALTKRYEGFQLVGTIHSHPGFDAFHSGIDKDDERYFDGVHLTIGKVDQPYFTICGTVVVNNNRFPIEPQELITGLVKVSWKPKPAYSYGGYSLLPNDDYQPFLNSLMGNGYNLGGTYLAADTTQYYNLALPDGKDYRELEFPTGWLDKVKKHIWSGLVFGLGALNPIGKKEVKDED